MTTEQKSEADGGNMRGSSREVMITGDFRPNDGWTCELHGHALPACPDCGDPPEPVVIGCFEATGLEDPMLRMPGDAEVGCGCGSAFTIVRGVLGAADRLCRRL